MAADLLGGKVKGKLLVAENGHGEKKRDKKKDKKDKTKDKSLSASW